MHCLVAIVGPTGIGKSRLALKLASVFNGEIVSADSRQVYRLLDIGTAKSTPEERASVPHHLIDIVSPDEDFSLAQYQEMAYRAIREIHERDRLPLLIGGSGLYVWAVLEGWKIPVVSPDRELRYNLERKAADSGIEELYRELERVDPQAALSIDRRNVRRVIRALEVQKRAKTPFSRLKSKSPSSFNYYILGLTADRSELYRRVDQRVDEMIGGGLINEVSGLLEKGYDINLPAMSGIGYRQISCFLKGEADLDEAVRRIKTETHRLIRHQYAWFRLKDERIHWFDVNKNSEKDIEKAIETFLSN